MYKAATARPPVSETYNAQEILSARPEKLILHLYDHAIRGCVAEDEQQVCRTLAQLMDALDFEYPSVALGLSRLYEYGMRMVRQAQFDRTLGILRELREAWRRALEAQPQSYLQRA